MGLKTGNAGPDKGQKRRDTRWGCVEMKADTDTESPSHARPPERQAGATRGSSEVAWNCQYLVLGLGLQNWEGKNAFLSF